MNDKSTNLSIGKKIQNYLINCLSGMAMGLFSTLIIGLIIKQIGILIGDNIIGLTLVNFGTLATIATGSAIAIGIANNLNAPKLAIFSSAVTGLIGANAAALVSLSLFVDPEAPTRVILTGAGDPLGAMIAGIVGVECSKIIAGKTKVDILLVPLFTIVSGSAVAYFIGPPISAFMSMIGIVINTATTMQPFLMGIIVSAIVGTCLTFPLSSAALSIMLGLDGLAAGAATVGCCCQMIGFAVASYRENGFQGVIAQGVGTSKLQLPNIIRNIWIFMPAFISSIILGPLSTCVFKMTNIPAGAGMGTAGFVGPMLTFGDMATNGEDAGMILVKILIIQFILPAACAFGISEFMRKKGLIKPNDMKLEL